MSKQDRGPSPRTVLPKDTNDPSDYSTTSLDETLPTLAAQKRQSATSVFDTVPAKRFRDDLTGPIHAGNSDTKPLQLVDSVRCTSSPGSERFEENPAPIEGHLSETTLRNSLAGPNLANSHARTTEPSYGTSSNDEAKLPASSSMEAQDTSSASQTENNIHKASYDENACGDRTNNDSDEESELLIIDTADASKTFSYRQASTVQIAAEFLFTCGLLEDAFPLYLLLWKQPRTNASESDFDRLIHCIRSACTRDHCLILEQPVKDQLSYINTLIVAENNHYTTLYQYADNICAVIAQACLLLLASARINATLDRDKDVRISQLHTAYQYLQRLKGIFFDFASATSIATMPIPAVKRLSAAIIEELARVPDQKERSKFATLVMPFMRRRTSSFSEYDHVGDPTDQANSSRTDCGTKDLMELALETLECTATSDPLHSPHPSLVSEIGAPLFCHIWSELAVWESQRSQFARISTMDCLAVLSLGILDFQYRPKGVPERHDIHKQKAVAIDLLDRLLPKHYSLSLDNNSTTRRFLQHFQKRYIWLLRRRALRISSPSPAVRRNLRVLVEDKLNVVLPDVPYLSDMNEDRPDLEAIGVFENSTLRRSLHPSEASSYRRFIECTKTAISLTTHRSHSSYASFMKHFADAHSFGSPFEKLSSSLGSMSIREECHVVETNHEREVGSPVVVRTADGSA